MARNLLAETSITSAFDHFPDGPNDIHSDEVRPVFNGLPAVDRDWVTNTVENFDPRNSADYPKLAAALGVSESVAAGLMVLLHPEA